MEKTIKFEDVVALINKAIENKLEIQYSDLHLLYIHIIHIFNKHYVNSLRIALDKYDEKTKKGTIRINKDETYGDDIKIDITKEESLEMELLFSKLKRYYENIITDYFNHFLDEEVVESPKTIDNIDE